MPHWEASSKEVRKLSDYFSKTRPVSVFSLNQKDKKILWTPGLKMVPLFSAPFLYPYIRSTMMKRRLNHLFASFSEPFLMPMLGKLMQIPFVVTITKDAPHPGMIEKKMPLLRRAAHVVVESLRHKEMLQQMNLGKDKLSLIYPGVKPEMSVVKAPNTPFTIIFATSPLGQFDFLNRGIFMMIEAAKQLPGVHFLFIWRKSNLHLLEQILKERGISNIEVKSGVIADMGEQFRRSDAVILPGLDYASLKPCPHSGLEGLAFEKPLLVSTPSSLAPVVHETQCGIVFEPNTQALVEAIKQLMTGYDQYRSHCHPTLEKYFSPDVFIKKYEEIYQRILK